MGPRLRHTPAVASPRPKRARPEPAPEPLPDLAPATGRHREILEAAMELVGERGYGGASLRELARRVGIQQPSLYHYFASKEEMVEQIIVTFYAAMMSGGASVIPDRLDQLPRLVAFYVKQLYQTRTHPQFVRFMFTISRLNPRFGRLMRRIFVDDVEAQAVLGLARFIARGELTETEAIDLVRLMTHSMGLRLMEERVLSDERPLGPDVDRYLDFCAAACEHWIAELRRRKGLPPAPSDSPEAT